MSAAKIEV